MILELTPFPIFPALAEPGVTSEVFWSDKTVGVDLSVLAEYYASVLDAMDKGLEIQKNFVTYISGPKTQQLRRNKEEIIFFNSLPEFRQMELNGLKRLLQ